MFCWLDHSGSQPFICADASSLCLATKENYPDVTDKPHGCLISPPSTESMYAKEWTSLEVGKWLEANGLAAHKTALVDSCQIYAFSLEYVYITILSAKPYVPLLRLCPCFVPSSGVTSMTVQFRSPCCSVCYIIVAQRHNCHVSPTRILPP